MALHVSSICTGVTALIPVTSNLRHSMSAAVRFKSVVIALCALLSASLIRGYGQDCAERYTDQALTTPATQTCFPAAIWNPFYVRFTSSRSTAGTFCP